MAIGYLWDVGSGRLTFIKISTKIKENVIHCLSIE